MKVICERASLLDAVNTVASIVPTRSPSPALSCLKLKATKVGSIGSVAVAGTDAEVAVHLSMSKVDVVQPGEAVVPADRVRAILQTLSDADTTVTIELEGDSCFIRGARSRFRLFAFPAADFPPIPDLDQLAKAPVPPRTSFLSSVATLSRLIARTSFATARETSRYAINGVLLKRDGKKLEMVATDGRRLALCRASVKLDKASDKADEKSPAVSCIIPAKSLSLLLKVGKAPEGIVKIIITDNRAFFAFYEEGAKDNATPLALVSTVLVEGAFPPYEDVIPKDQDKKISAGKAELAEAMRSASVLTNEDSRGVKMNFSSKDKSLKLSSRAAELGDSDIDVPLSGFEGESIEINFNPQFISEALKAIDDPEVIIELKAPNKPGILKVGSEFIYVVMPVNLPS
jgi:DNA polymerase III subunit beta